MTDTNCRWSKRSAAREPTDTIEKIYPKPEGAGSYEPFGEVDYKAVLRRLQEDLRSCGGNAGAGVLFLLEEEPPRFSASQVLADLGLPNLKELLMSPACRQTSNLPEFLTSKLHLSWENILSIVAGTDVQSSYSSWSLVREWRLTASNFGEILKFCNRSLQRNCNPAPSLMRRFVCPTSLDGVHSVMWGRDNEPAAISFFEESTGKKVVKSGIWLHESGVLGASPDGLVGSTETVEVKCPYRWRSSDNLSTVITSETDYIVFYKDGEWHLREDHVYYDQIQGQLYFSRRQVCNLVIWAEKSAEIFEIPFNQSWAVENVPKLLNFVPYVWSTCVDV